MKTNYIYLSACLLILSACNHGKNKLNKSSQIFDIHLRNDLSISIDSLGGMIGQRITNVVVDQNGYMYFGDQSLAKIHIISPEGRYAGSIGRRGRGPGDFNHLMGISIYKDTLYVLENEPDRFSAFRLNNRHLIRMRPFPNVMVKKHRLGAPKLIYPMVSGTYEMVFPNYTMARFGIPYRHVTFSIFSHNLEPIDTVVLTFPPSKYFHYTDPKNGGKAIFGNFGKGLTPKTLVAFDAKGNLYEASSDSLYIRVFNSSGQKIKTLSYDYIPPKFTQGDLDSITSKIQSHYWKRIFRIAIKQNHITRWMSMQNLLIDDKGRCWVELMNPRKKKQTWWVFDTAGKLRWKFKLSRHVQLYVVQNHEAYGIWRKKGSYPKLVRYHVEGI